MTVTAAAPTRRRRRIWLIAVPAVVLAALVGWRVAIWRAGVRELRAVIATIEQTDPHWTLEDLEQARATVPDTDNSAAVVRAARALTNRPPGHPWGDWVQQL